MKKLLLSLGTALFCTVSFAQNSAIFKAQSLEQKGEFEEAAHLLETALENPKTTKFAQMYHMTAENYAKIFNAELEKAAHSMPFDTLKFVTTLDKMIGNYTKSHEADMQPDKKGNVKPQYEMANRARLMVMLDYYNYAAMFMYQQRDTVRALDYFEKYLDLPNNPIFNQGQADSIRTIKKAAYSQTALNMATLNYGRHDWDKAIKFADIALKDTLGTHDLYIIKMQSLSSKGDSAAWLATLKEAVGRTEDPGFMSNLLYYYVSKNEVTEAEKMANDLVAASPTSKAAWYMKGCVELNLKKQYTAARECFQKALDIDPDFVDANINISYTYINQVVAERNAGKFKFIGTNKLISSKDKPAYEKELATVKGYYKDAQKYMEHVRELIPDQPKNWAYTLQMIYENLQMKDQKAEMDEIIKGL